MTYNQSIFLFVHFVTTTMKVQAHKQIFNFNFSEALEDLSKAIQLDQNKRSRALSAALCQRGLLHRKNGNVDLAKEDFEKAAKLGSSFAKSQVFNHNESKNL